MTDLHYRSLSDVCRRIKSGELKASQVTEAMLARIDRLEPELGAYACVMAEQAMSEAERLDSERASGKPLGLLHGVPIAVKDLFFTRGVVTASGTRVMADFVPDEDATVVARLKASGAVIIGKTKLWEGAFGVHHPDVRAPLNPWSSRHWTGGSSSGSAVATAAGLAFGALGSDTGGSIRFPCASCGLVGIKPTYGRVSRYGSFPLAGSLDHVGPMTRSVEDAVRMLQVLAGPDPRDPTTLPGLLPNYADGLSFGQVDGLAGLTIGVDWAYASTGVEQTVVDTVREALDVFRELGAAVRDVAMPRSAAALIAGWSVTCGVECAQAHADFYPARRRDYGPALAGLIEIGRAAPTADYEALEATRRDFRCQFDRLLETVDLLITPCMPRLPPEVEAIEWSDLPDSEAASFLTFTAPFNYSGHPALVLPAGVSATGLPLSFQLVGRRLAEPTLVRAGFAYEQAHGGPAHPDV